MVIFSSSLKLPWLKRLNRYKFQSVREPHVIISGERYWFLTLPLSIVLEEISFEKLLFMSLSAVEMHIVSN